MELREFNLIRQILEMPTTKSNVSTASVHLLRILIYTLSYFLVEGLRYLPA